MILSFDRFIYTCINTHKSTSRTFPSPQKVSLCLFSVNATSLVQENYGFSLWYCGLKFSFLQFHTNIPYFESNFFNIFWNLSMLLCVSAICSLLMLRNVSFYWYATNVFIHLRTGNIYGVSNFYILFIKLPKILAINFCVDMFSFFWEN